MRLRQAHAILETATALEATGLGFKIRPYHLDHPNLPIIRRDYMTGGTDLTDPDMNGLEARSYNIDLLPGPGDNHIQAHLTLGFGPDRQTLLYSEYNVAPDDSHGDEKFRSLVGTSLAKKIAEAVREHEAAYERRTHTI